MWYSSTGCTPTSSRAGTRRTRSHYSPKAGSSSCTTATPPNAAAAQPALSPAQAGTLGLPDWTGEWCGDVWKTICSLRSRKDLRAFVLDCDCGLGIITRGKPEDGLELTDADIEKMGYADLDQDRKRLLDLKPASFLQEFLDGRCR